METTNVTLSFSQKQLEEHALKAYQIRETMLVSLPSYEGKRFTNRNPRPNDPLRYDDAKIVYKGDIDESKMRYDQKSAIDVLRELDKLPTN
jgi:hypothetical protein